jgi:hypothetical protein
MSLALAFFKTDIRDLNAHRRFPSCGEVQASSASDVLSARPPTDSFRLACKKPTPLGEFRQTSSADCSTYTQGPLSAPTRLHRLYGDDCPKFGSFWMRTPIAGPAQFQMDAALNPAWGNSLEHVVTIEAPAGTEAFEGVAGPQEFVGGGVLLGGGNQVFIRNVSPDWEVGH